MSLEPDAVIKSVEEYGLKAILQKPFIERISEDQYTELDSGDREESLFSAETIVEELQKELENVQEYDHEQCACTKAEKVIKRVGRKFDNLDSSDGDPESE